MISAKRTNYMFACLMVKEMKMMRLRAIEDLMKSFPKTSQISWSLIQKLVLLNTEQDAQTLVAACGYKYSNA